MSALKSSIAFPEMTDIEIVVDEGNSFNMQDNEGGIVLEGMNNTEASRGNGDEACLVAEAADILSSFMSVARDSTISYLLATIRSSRPDLNIFKNHVRKLHDR